MERLCKEKASKYIANVEYALKQIRCPDERRDLCSVVEQALFYLKDASFYLERSDCLTSIACSSYAEGLLDALRLLGLVEFQWRAARASHSEKKVLVGGVFDILHPGHIYFLERAREYGRVYVVVARDQTVIETKGRPPLMSENDRVRMLNSLRVVEEAFLGDYPPSFENAIRRVNPDYIVLGKDQAWLYPTVERALKSTGIASEIITIEERIEGYSSTTYRNKLSQAP
ncbi:DUF357 domain-containing protein [Infirmifilum lucidum]|uniref:DUF357 domain-containing protein n=1 Tax=Infirmifilum lucidum TaxID=2776706 RepID=A0A7L9FL81_9CREN|nr:DUF357 domain-containing protein [Infirmifilum lucidum]QOJ79616.1 DUF357 domain-containing protein [Infirmifilum lucidum]